MKLKKEMFITEINKFLLPDKLHQIYNIQNKSYINWFRRNI